MVVCPLFPIGREDQGEASVIKPQAKFRFNLDDKSLFTFDEDTGRWGGGGTKLDEQWMQK